MRRPLLPSSSATFRRHLLGLPLVLAALSACGGGGDSGTSNQAAVAPIGVAPEVAPSTYQVNPAASWKPLASNQDYFGGSLASVNLLNLGFGSSTTGERSVQLQAQGSFRYDKIGSLSHVATGLFVDSLGKAVTPGHGAGFVSPSGSADCGLPDTGDSIPEDFVIPTASALTVTLPAGATELRLSVSDCYYKDNSLSDDPLRVTVKIL